MSTPSGPLLLSSGLGEQPFYNTQANIYGDYTKAKVLPSEPRSLWIVYTVTEWGHHHSRDRNVEKIVRLDHPVIMDSPIRSIQGFNETNPGVILFEHSQYRGYGKLFESTNRDISQFFPPGQISGVSSMIITGGEWSFYNIHGTIIKINGQTVLGPGDHDLGSLPANDQIKSIVYVRPFST